MPPTTIPEQDRLTALLNQLTGARVTRVAAGGSVGSIVGITLNNRDREWYFSLECSWRLQDRSAFIASSRSDAAPGGPLATGVEKLVGLIVSSALLTGPAFDLTIHFNQNMRLEVFADIVSDGTCWFLLGPNKLEVSVEPAGTIRFA